MTGRPREQRKKVPTRFLRASDLQARLGVSRTTIYGWVAAGLFPRPIPLGPRAVGWIESEVEEWSRNRIANTRGGAQGGARLNPNRERTE